MVKSHVEVATEALDAEIARLTGIRDLLRNLHGGSKSNGSSPSTPPVKAGSGSKIKSYWAKMTPLQRKNEMRRRVLKRKAG